MNNQSNENPGANEKPASPPDTKDPLKQFWDFLNNPLVANSALGIALYKLIDPGTVKNYLQNLQRQQNAMAKAMNEQSEIIKSLLKEVRRLTELAGGETLKEESNYGKPLSVKRKESRPGTALLD